jgi:hypothetical protein
LLERRDACAFVKGDDMKKSLAALAVAGTVSVGCVTNGNDFKSETNWIKAGQTKQSDVKMVLGEPYSVGNAGGKATWTYGYYRYKLLGKSLQKELKLYWRPDGTVDTFTFNSSFPDDMGLAVTK